jgi:hypothetical protein
MNIFYLDEDPAAAAQFHNDSHCVKMILESAQMLSTAARENGVNEGYKPCFRHHPCTQWAANSLSNWRWLRRLALELDTEYKWRYENSEDHKSAKVVRGLPEPNLPRNGFTELAQAMPDYCKKSDPVRAYRTYYREEKSHLAEWTKRGKPGWYE